MIWKKVTRFIIPCLIAILCVFSSSLSAKADTIQAHGTVSTSYGSYTWSAQQASSTLPIQVTLPFVGISFPYNSGTSFSLDYTFKNTYSGVMSVTVTANNTWSVDNVNILTSGCNLDSIPSDHASYKTSHTFNIRVKQAENFSFVIYGAGTTVFLANTTVSISHNISVENKPVEIDQTLDLYLPGMSTSLSGLGYDSNDSTSLNSDTLAYDIFVIKNYIDGIEGYLSAGNEYLVDIRGHVDNLENQLDYLNMIAPFNFPNYQHAAIYWGYSQVRGTATHPNLEFWRGLPVFYLLMSEINDSAYTQARAIRVPGNSTVVIYVSSNRLFDSSLFNIYKSGNAEITVSYSANYDTSYQNIYNVISIKNASAGVNYVELEPTANMYIMPYYIGNPNVVPDEVRSLFGLEYDNTYTRLLESIANGIGNISVEQIIENNTNINNYNDYQTSINNVENNYYTEYNNQSTVIENNNTFDFSGLDTTGVTAFNDLFTNIYNIPLVKYPILITLLGLVIVIILG